MAESLNQLTQHNPDQILEESSVQLDPRQETCHMPELMTNAEFDQLNDLPVSRQLVDMFRSVAHHKGQFDTCLDLTHPRKEWWSEDFDSLLYVVLFIVNGLLVYRGIKDIITDLPFLAPLDKEVRENLEGIVGVLLGGTLGLAIEIAIGKVLFVKFSLKWFCDGKMQSLAKEIRTFSRNHPILKYRLKGKIALCREVFPDFLKISFSWFDGLLSFFCFVGLGIDAFGAKRTIDKLIEEIIKKPGQSISDPLSWWEYINYIPALLPVVVVLIIAIILGYTIYFPRELNFLSGRFQRKLQQFDPYELKYLIERNNDLYQQATWNERIGIEDVKKIQIEHEIKYRKDCRDRCAIDARKRQNRTNLQQPTQPDDWVSSIDEELDVDLLNEVTSEEARLKIRSLTKQIRELEKQLIPMPEETKTYP